MAENNWLLNDSAPVPLGQEFAAAAPAKAWGWFGMPAAGEGSQFEAAANPSTETFWTPAEIAFNNAQGGGSIDSTGALSLAPLTIAASAQETITGSAALATASIQIAALSDEALGSTVAAILAALTIQATASEQLDSQAALSLASIVAAASAAERIDSASALTLAALLVAVSGSETLESTVLIGLAPIQIAATSSPSIDCTGALALAPFWVSGVVVPMGGGQPKPRRHRHGSNLYEPVAPVYIDCSGTIAVAGPKIQGRLQMTLAAKARIIAYRRPIISVKVVEYDGYEADDEACIDAVLTADR